MTTRPDHHPAAPAPTRAERKARLEAAIEQQRIDILVEAGRWRAAAHGIDHAWQRLMRYRAPLYAMAGVLLYRGARRPASLARLTRRLAAGALLLGRARRLWRQLR